PQHLPSFPTRRSSDLVKSLMKICWCPLAPGETRLVAADSNTTFVPSGENIRIWLELFGLVLSLFPSTPLASAETTETCPVVRSLRYSSEKPLVAAGEIDRKSVV